MRIVLIGSNGALGTALERALCDYDLLVPSREELDVTDHEAVSKYLHEADPEIVISTAAYHDVDKCEENPRKAFNTNSFATKNLARVCRDIDAKLAWISTNFVFSGHNGPYSEDDNPDPINIYGKSKALGEYFIKQNLDSYYIVRTAGLFGKKQSVCKEGKNLIDTFRELDEIDAKTDEYFTMTYTRDLAGGIHKMLLEGHAGIYHIFNQGRHTVYEIAKEVSGNVNEVKRADFENEPIYPEDASLRTHRDIVLRPLFNAIDHYIHGEKNFRHFG